MIVHVCRAQFKDTTDEDEGLARPTTATVWATNGPPLHDGTVDSDAHITRTFPVRAHRYATAAPIQVATHYSSTGSSSIPPFSLHLETATSYGTENVIIMNSLILP